MRRWMHRDLSLVLSSGLSEDLVERLKFDAKAPEF